MSEKQPRRSGVSRRQVLQGGLSALVGSVGLPALPDVDGAQASAANQTTPLYLDTTQPLDDRVRDLVSQLTLDEKVAQMGSSAPAVERLNIPAYNWWNEALHGVGRAGIATVFPQAIGMAATWNTDLMHRIATVISDEGRAKHHEAVRNGIFEPYLGLTFWSPNINIFRDPRWGRGQETYGEDPYLTGRLGVNFVRGLQGDDPKYLKTVATPKHFAVHSGPEADRHSFDAIVSQRDLRMTYLPAFQACIVEAKAQSIMGAYNRVNGEPCCASPTLLGEILRGEWGFDGYVVSDCGAITDIHRNHRLVRTGAEAAALAVKNGCDLECCRTYGIPCNYGEIQDAIDEGLITEAELDVAVTRLFKARFMLGMFDPPEDVPYTQIPYRVVDSPEHRAVALEAAQQSLVLLKNEANLLPLDRESLKSIAVIGPAADNTLILLGNYMGTPAEPISVLAGIQAAVSPDTTVTYAQGCGLVDLSDRGFAEAVTAATNADVAVVVLGLSQLLEGEEGQQEGNPPGKTSQGDRLLSLNLPLIQQRLLESIHATGTPVILVLMNGSMIAATWADENIPAILEAWYPGQAAGTAIANVLFGDFNPGGRLPITFYRDAADLPPFDDYDMTNRTYRYFTGDPLYKFGYGLSYTRFAYHDLQITPAEAEGGTTITVQVEVENTGERSGDEVVQLYVQDVEASLPVPLLQLQGFTRIRLNPGEKQTVQFTLTPEQLSFADEAGQWVLEPGVFNLWIGGQQPNLNAEVQPDNVIGGALTITA